ncbi:MULTISPECIES: DegT/DnrJ/EryC1/StrS family aminotransferase [unclassified Mesorhizobium]|uniref:DegT/DnrJ/EryC1/StrS family aminotransferase n=1 Tax=unclassified Mesorhizobium TaxID=325217 RepID=UPI001091B94C|nr:MULTISPECIES: DegT/DnrJ/EryC1/StrS family aminotransferase [unclassified Mesorhizobium]TGQ40544.1 aminotransferase [Mesorhizobium sp. M4B.F.Ca.ET.214.01.1.1]TGQ60601.1 aminotransferase [Mesorhizobium sp. M4B.F.Ca.ET.211.01.1.1]TGU36469.1 aminotransferase [Mesorhizobium sp. M4B.F.Ca.ET.150.01.1.1]TIX17029.1 MAG: aminotransferase [Mesorhizobium sp.]
MAEKVFTGNFTQQQPLPEAAIEAAVSVLRSGRLHRYNTAPNEISETAALEHEYAEWQGARYCLAVASGGQAIQIALRAAGVGPGDAVLTNGFTLAPVPGSIAAVGAHAILVEIDRNLVMDLDDLSAKIRTSGARHILVSHMRGHLCDMERLMAIASAADVVVIEDCAHTMGSSWNGRKSGAFGQAGCFSTQTYKHLNSGEGGLLTSDDPDFMARATLMSGSYMLYDRHGAGPDRSSFFQARYETPQFSTRMDNLRAAILRPQLAEIDTSIDNWNHRYDRMAEHLECHEWIRLPKRPRAEKYVGSSIQFFVDGIASDTAVKFLAMLGDSGVELKWFGSPEPTGYTSAHTSWRYIAPQKLPATERILSGLFDMRIPLSFSVEDCDQIAHLIIEKGSQIFRAGCQ